MFSAIYCPGMGFALILHGESLSFGEMPMLRTVVLILLILLLLGALPVWPYSAGWGFYPSGGLGLVLIIVIVLIVLGQI